MDWNRQNIVSNRQKTTSNRQIIRSKRQINYQSNHQKLKESICKADATECLKSHQQKNSTRQLTLVESILIMR